MRADIKYYVYTYLICQQDKFDKRREAGLLQPQPILEQPWTSVSIDFIGGFLKIDGKGLVFVVVDRFSKIVMFIATLESYLTKEMAVLFFRHMVKHCGLPL